MRVRPLKDAYHIRRVYSLGKLLYFLDMENCSYEQEERTPLTRWAQPGAVSIFMEQQPASPGIT